MTRTHRLALLAGALSMVAGCRPSAPSSAPAPSAVAAADTTGPAIPRRRSVSFPATWPHQPRMPAVFAPHAIVASDDRLASEAGVEILKQGGNAVDAAVAVGFALAVAYPEAGNLGGGGYMVIRMADGRQAAVDYREMAPLAATRNMYLDANGKLTDKSLVGALASGVPGAVAGMSAALAKYGTMTLAQVMAPAIRLADQGFVVDSGFARSIARDRRLIAQFAGADVFLPGGEPPAVGTTFRQPMLARTLKLIAARGPDVFYKGEIADSIAAEERRDGGIMTAQDLAHYHVEMRTPIVTPYRGYTLLTMPPSSSGGVTITETLNVLSTYDSMPPFGSTEYVHLLASAYQRAFIDRNAKLGDPAFTSIPMAQLTGMAYARELRRTIDPAHATPTSQLMKEMPALAEGTQTTHYSVVDARGNAVATTTTINSLYGSGVYIRGAGFFMNNEMDDFAAEPGKPNQFGLVQGEADAVAPGKRPLSAMSPTIVLDPKGQVLLVVGARGGPRIITATSQVILNVIDHHMSIADAMSAPRIHDQALPDTLLYERGGLAPAVIDSLKAMGWSVAPTGGVALANAIMRVTGGWEGMGDPRQYTASVGY